MRLILERGPRSACHNWTRPGWFRNRKATMIRWAIVFFVVALFGFGGIDDDAKWMGRILLVVFLVLIAVSAILGRKSVGV